MKLYLHERVRFVDFVDLLLVGLAITISAFGKPNPVYVLVSFYLVIMLWKLGYTIATRDNIGNLKAAIITGLLNFINKEMLNDSNNTRFTVFRVAPYRPDYIIPWIRFKRGGTGGRREAFDSRARFQRNEGITGKVWAKPPGTLAVHLIPEIPGRDRNLLRVLYAVYGVKPQTFDALSDHMCKVRCIISYVCLDEHAQFLNLLSLDIESPVVRVPIGTESKAVYLEFQDGEKKTNVDTQSLWRLVSTIGTVLQQYKLEEKQR